MSEPAEDNVAESVPAAPGGEAAGQDDLQRKFREALERKKAQHSEANGGNGGKDPSKIHGSHGPVGGKRTFRRKSGG